MNQAIITTSWDDGSPPDLKLAELLFKYDTPATFYIPIENRERQCLTETEVTQIARHFDIGGHACHHADLTLLSHAEAKQEIVLGKERLEKIIGRNLIAFCYPKGKYDPQTKELVKTAGFKGARTTKPFIRSMRDPFQTGTTVQVHDFSPSHYIMTALESLDAGLAGHILKKGLYAKKWDIIAMETLNYVVNHGGIWHLWGHSWEIEAENNWQSLTGVLQEIKWLSNQVRKVDNSQLIEIKCAERPLTVAGT